ncbi:MAG: hypothetical protein M1829_005936 [Trizodia sp. TS-e1964]|nr:MAG: hypothetical protein M1829_005936 [Trizodia sp. TS-e1964]
MASSWTTEYLSALADRDAREQANTEIFQSYTRLADRTAPPPNDTPHLPSNNPTAAEPVQEKERGSAAGLAETLSRLRLDLADAQRSKTELEKRYTTAADELAKVQARSKIESKRLLDLSVERTNLATRVRDKEEELRGKAKLLENVQDEMISLNLQLNIAEERTLKLQGENKELVDRWMAKIGLEADAMNRASKYS